MGWHHYSVFNGHDIVKKFQYKKPWKKKPPIESKRPAEEVAPKEQLTGFINGIPADSMAEERLAASLSKDPRVAGFEYNYVVGTMGLPGWKKLDFLVQKTDGQILALSIKDTEFIHHGTAATAEDVVEEQYIVEELRKQQIYVSGIQSIDAKDLDNQELADRKAKEIL
jgi:hypothetical protein